MTWVYYSINITGQRNDKNVATVPWECLGLSLLAGCWKMMLGVLRFEGFLRGPSVGSRRGGATSQDYIMGRAPNANV